MSSTDLPLLVTGAAGFIGARFVESCNARGRAVFSVDDPALFGTRAEHQHIEFGRVLDGDGVASVVEREQLEIGGIVHLGACTDTTELDEGFLERVNLDASKQLWELARARSVPFVYASSAATYGGGELGYDDDPARMRELKPLNPYGESKLQFDLWALEEVAGGREPVAWSGFKFFNVYGFGERHKGRMASVVLQAFDQIRATGRVKLFRSHRDAIADGEQKRDFVCVEDVVEVLWHGLEAPIRRGIYNLGTGEARTFLDLVRATFAAMEVEEAIDFIDTPADIRERYQYFTQAEMRRLREAGFAAPFTSLEAGVARYVERLGH